MMNRPMTQIRPGVAVESARLKEFCRRWKISRLCLFGSALRDDFTDKSDIDLLVDFLEDAEWSLFDHVRMEDELAAVFGRKVDLVTRHSIEGSDNWVRRKDILETAEQIYG